SKKRHSNASKRRVSMSRYTKWYADPADEEGESPKGGPSEPSQSDIFIRAPDEPGAGEKHSMTVIVSAEEELVGITQSAWEWLMDAVGTDEQGMTTLLSAHNRQAPTARISSATQDAGAADLLAWLVAAQETAKGVTPRVA